MPIRPVARQTRCFQAEHRAHLTGAQIVNQALETGALHGAACASSQILVDHLDLAKSPAPRDINELILPALALKVELDLRLGGLTYINDRLALEDGGRNLITARHGRSPPLQRRRRRSAGLRLWRSRSLVASNSARSASASRVAC